MATRGRALVDGGGARRIALAMLADRLDLRPATDSDAFQALAWRNHPEIRRLSRRPGVLDPEAHLDWWRRALAAGNRRLWIAHVQGDAVGVLRLDLEGAEAEVSLYTDPELTGIGLGRAMLSACQRRIASGEVPARRIVAEVLPKNLPSRRVFAAAGFTSVSARCWKWEAVP
jgi:RimJ/RimL family protein N-acetyltransferase